MSREPQEPHTGPHIPGSTHYPNWPDTGDLQDDLRHPIPGFTPQPDELGEILPAPHVPNDMSREDDQEQLHYIW